jgi:hypothetical protein
MRSVQTPRARLVSGLALDRNPLRRPSDRIEAWLRFVLLLAFVPLTVLAAFGVVRWVHADGTREVRAQAALRPVTAVLIRAAETPDPLFGSVSIDAAARWTAVGLRHVGEVPVPMGAPAGTPVRIWVNSAGAEHQPPLTGAQVMARTVLAVVASPAAIALSLWVLWCAVRWLLDRHRSAEWARAWSLVARQWTR